MKLITNTDERIQNKTVKKFKIVCIESRCLMKMLKQVTKSYSIMFNDSLHLLKQRFIEEITEVKLIRDIEA